MSQFCRTPSYGYCWNHSKLTDVLRKTNHRSTSFVNINTFIIFVSRNTGTVTMRSGVSTSGPLNSTYTQQVKMVMLCHPYLIPSFLLTIKCVSNADHPTQFVHSVGMCRIWRFFAVLRSFFHSSLLCTFSFHPSPPTILPSSLTSACHLFLGLPLNLVVPKFIYNTHLGILFSSILCTCPNQRNLFSLIVSV